MRLVIISLDAVFQADADFLLSLPHLGELAQQGVFCSRVQTIYPTLTYPIHASIITGSYPQRHGIAHNEVYLENQPAGPRPWHWEASDIKAETLFEAASRAGRECAAVLWPTTGKSRFIRYNLPEVLALPGENQTLKVLRYGSPLWLLGNELRFGHMRKGISQPGLDDYATRVAIGLIEKQSPDLARINQDRPPLLHQEGGRPRHMPDLLALHLTECDTARHLFGTFSQEAKTALTRLDERVGRIMQALADRGLMEDTIFAVITDHGHKDIQGSLPLDAWLVKNKVPARAHSLGFGAYLRLRRADYQVVLKALVENAQELHLQHIYTREELRVMHMPEDLLLAVEPEEGMAIVEDEDEVKHSATHGFSRDEKEAKTLFFVRGPLFKKGHVLPSCQIVDIAPTLARAAGLVLRDAQGEVLFDAFDRPV